MIEEPGFRLEGIVKEKENLSDFEGPLSLILLLLQKNKIEIRDIKIAEITDQYLEYINKMQEMDLDVASEFVRMASYLLYLKTKSVLMSDEEQVTELELLIQSLETLQAKGTLTSVKEVSPALGEAYKTGVLYFGKPAEALPAQAGEYEHHHTSSQLLQALYNALKSSEEKVIDIKEIQRAMPHRIVYSVRSKSRQILSRLKLRNITLNELYSECTSNSEIVATFISVLELCSSGSISVYSAKDGNGYELSFTGGDIEDIIEKIEE